MTTFSPREIVSELDRYIIGQHDAKRAVAIALRNRWRRQQLTGPMREEVMPKNILMIGPTGVGKTEISRRLAKLAGAPFIKVEATKFTEVGYVVAAMSEQIIRSDLVEVGIGLVRDRRRKEVSAKAELSAEERVLTALVGPAASPATRESFRKRLRAGELNDKEIEVEVKDPGGMPAFDVPGMPGASVGVMNIGDMLGKASPRRPHQDAPHHRRRVPRSPAQRGIRQAPRQRASQSGGDHRRRERWHRLPRRDRQDLRPRGHARRRRCQPARASSAISSRCWRARR